jgi:hypothetical protein
MRARAYMNFQHDVLAAQAHPRWPHSPRLDEGPIDFIPGSAIVGLPLIFGGGSIRPMNIARRVNRILLSLLYLFAALRLTWVFVWR